MLGNPQRLLILPFKALRQLLPEALSFATRQLLEGCVQFTEFIWQDQYGLPALLPESDHPVNQQKHSSVRQGEQHLSQLQFYETWLCG